jgi:protoporphyrinogen oxidase
MTLAHRLAQHGHRVTLFERAEHLGGLAGAWSLGDVVWDRHYHVTLLSDSFTRSLLTELGLEHEIEWVQTRTGFTIIYAARVKNWKRLEKIPVADWLRRWSGKKTLDRIWLPLLRAKLGESYKQTSAAFIWATIARMYAARRSGLKREMFGYVPGGYARILDAYQTLLNDEGVYLMLGTDVRRVGAGDAEEITVETAGGTRIGFDRVVLTVAAPVAAKLCPELSEEERLRLQEIQYQGIVCASVLLKRPLAGFYVTNITDSWVPYTAVIEMSALVDHAQFGGHTLAYLPKYLSSDDPSFSTTDEEWERSFLGALSKMYPGLSADDVISFRVSRERYVHALPTIGYSQRLPKKQTSLRGLHIVNSAHIVNGTLNVNETIKLAEDAIPGLLLRRNPESDPSTIDESSS